MKYFYVTTSTVIDGQMFRNPYVTNSAPGKDDFPLVAFLTFLEKTLGGKPQIDNWSEISKEEHNRYCEFLAPESQSDALPK